MIKIYEGIRCYYTEEININQQTVTLLERKPYTIKNAPEWCKRWKCISLDYLKKVVSDTTGKYNYDHQKYAKKILEENK